VSVGIESSENLSDVRVNPRVGWRKLGDLYIAFNCDNQMVSLWSMEGGQVWEEFASGASFDEARLSLSRLWNVSEREADEAIIPFLKEIMRDGYLKVDGSNDGGSPGIEDGSEILTMIEMMAIESLSPFAVTFEVTYDCNERCIHCYMESGRPSLLTDEVTRILDDLAEAGTVFVSFTGGEFFTRKDALTILDEAHKRHFVIDILTNATLVTPEIAEIGKAHV